VGTYRLMDEVYLSFPTAETPYSPEDAFAP
jgi:hypothetical protein